jgi:transposase-like protein
MSIIAKRPFTDETAAFDYLERTLWPDGPVCPHCGTIGRATKLGGRKGDGKRQARLGLWKCNERECRKQFTVKVGTVFEHGRIPLHKMLQAVYLLCCSKKGCSSHQLHRILQITYKSAWFLSHRIREAMRNGELAPLGGLGGVVEIDETLFGRQEGSPKRKGGGAGYASKWSNVVLTLVERGGSVRSFHIDGTTIGTLMPIIRANVNRENTVMTDAASWYANLEATFQRHESVKHEDDEYVRYTGATMPDGKPFVIHTPIRWRATIRSSSAA